MKCLMLVAWLLWPTVLCGQTSVFANIHKGSFDIIQMGDIHAGGSLGAFSQTAVWSNSINEIINSNGILWNCPILISAGDNFEMTDDTDRGTNVTLTILTNQLWRLKTAGISVMTCPGNHDCDASDAVFFYNTYLGTNFIKNDPRFVRCRTNGDARDLVYAMTNSDIKIVLVSWRWMGDDSGTVFPDTNAVIAAYQPNTAWAMGVANEFSNHLFIGVSHYFLNTDCQPGFEDNPNSSAGYKNIGPGYEAWIDGYRIQANAFMNLCGHVRQSFWATAALNCADGHIFNAFKFNTQATQGIFPVGWPPNGGVFAVYHFDPDTETVRARLYNSVTHTYIAEGQFAGITNVDTTISWRGIPRR